METIMNKSKNQALSSIQKMTYDLMIARFLLSLQQLSPNLIKCFKREGRNQWNDRSLYLQEKRIQTWKRWVDVMIDRLSQLITDTLCQCLQSNISGMLQIFPVSFTVTRQLYSPPADKAEL